MIWSFSEMDSLPFPEKKGQWELLHNDLAMVHDQTLVD